MAKEKTEAPEETPVETTPASEAPAEEKKPETESETKKGALGLEPNIAGALAYFLGFISGAFLIVTEKEDKFVRFHAWQSVIFSLVWMVASWAVGLLPWMGGTRSLISTAVSLGGFVLWLVLMYKAYNKEMYELPVIGEFAKKQSEQ